MKAPKAHRKTKFERILLPRVAKNRLQRVVKNLLADRRQGGSKLTSFLNKTSSSITCPITLTAPAVPVLSSEGHLYDFSALGMWLLQQRQTEGPVTKTLIKNITLIRYENLELDKLDDKAKDEIAEIYAKLELCMPEVIISGIYEISDIKARVDKITKPFYDELGRPAPGETVFFNAASFANLPLMKSLYNMGMNPNHKHFCNQTTALHMAVEREHVEVIEWLLSLKETDPSPQKSDNGDTPLIYAAYNNLSSSVEMFLQCDLSDINVKGYEALNNMTALEVASKNGHSNCVEKLLTIADIDLNNALPLADHMGHTEIIDMLLNAYLNQLLKPTNLLECQLFNNTSLKQTFNKYAYQLWLKLKTPNPEKLSLPKDLFDNNGQINKEKHKQFVIALINDEPSYKSVLENKKAFTTLREIFLPQATSSSWSSNQELKNDIRDFCSLEEISQISSLRINSDPSFFSRLVTTPQSSPLSVTSDALGSPYSITNNNTTLLSSMPGYSPKNENEDEDDNLNNNLFNA